MSGIPGLIRVRRLRLISMLVSVAAVLAAGYAVAFPLHHRPAPAQLARAAVAAPQAELRAIPPTPLPASAGARSAAARPRTGTLPAPTGPTLPRTGPVLPRPALGAEQAAAEKSALTAAEVADSAATAAAPVAGRVDPTALVVAPHPVPAPTVSAIARRAPALSVLTAGTVPLTGHPVSVVGVLPASFRAFTPPPTQSSDALWNTILRGDAAVSFGLARSRHLRLGQTVMLGQRKVRIGAEADFGLSQAAVVVGPALARDLGLPTEEMLLGRLDASSAAASLTPLLGGGKVINLIPPAPPAPAATASRPTSWQQLYIDAAATCPGLPWSALAAIGQIESDHGRNIGPSSAGAEGPMQFLPSTFAQYGYDPFGRGRPNIDDPIDSVYSAARLLCSDGGGSGPTGLAGAVFAYNHSPAYVRDVLGLATSYARSYP